MSGHPMGHPDSFCSPGVSRDVYPHIRPSIRGVHRNPHCKNLHGGYSSRYTPQRSLRFNRSLSRYHDSSEPEYVRQKEMDPRKRTPRSSAPHSHWSISPRRSTTYKLDDEHNSPGRQVYASHHARLPKRHLLPDYQVTPRILPRDNLQKLHGHKRFSHWGCATKGFRYHYQHDLASERSLMNSKWVEMSSNQHGGPRHNGQLLPRDGINNVAQEREVQVPLPCLGTSDSADIYNPEEPTNETCDDGLDTSPAVQHMATHCYSMEIEQTASTQAAMEPERTWPLENEEADFFGQAGTIFPHTCSICGVRLLCDKGWTQHITGKKHKNKCWVFAMRFPKWNQKIKNHHSTRTEHEDCENVSHTQLSGSAATSEIPTSQAQPLEESLSTFPNPDRLPGPARVIHLFNLPMCNYTEGDIIRLGLPFGKVTNYILMRSKNQAFLEMAQPPGAQAFVEFYSSRPLHLYGYPVQVQMSSAYHHLVLKKRGRGIEAILTEDCSLHGLKEKANETRTRERSRSPLLHEQPSQHCGDRSSISSWARTDGKQHKSGPYASVVCLQSQATHSSSETKFPQCSFVVEPRDSAPKCDNALAGDHNVEERVMIEEDESNNYPDITTSSIEISNTGHEMVCQTKTYELVNGFNGDHSLSRCSGQEKEEQELLMENLEEIGTDEKDRAEKEELENNVESYVYEKERDKVQNGVKQEEGGSFMWSSNSRFLGNISPLYEDSKDADDGKKEHFIKMVVDKYSMVIVQRDDQWRSEQAETETEGGGSESAEEMKCGGEPYQNTEVVNGKQESDTVASCSEGNVDKVNDIPELKDPTPTIQCPVAPTVNMVDTDKHQKNIVLQRSSTNERISHFKLKQQISPDKGFMEASAEGSTENLLNISDKTSMRMSSLDNTTALTGVCDKCHGSGCQDLHEVALVSMEFTIPGASAREEQDGDFNKSVGAVHDCSTSLDTTKEQMFLQSDNDHQSSSGVSMTSGTSISVVKKTRTTCGPCLPIGAHFVVPKAGFYCTLCHLFYLNEEKARVRHCSSAVHYRNVEKYLVEKLSEMERCCVDEPAGAPCGDEPEPS